MQLVAYVLLNGSLELRLGSNMGIALLSKHSIWRKVL